MTVQRLIYTDPIKGNTSSNAGFVEGGSSIGGQNTLLTADMTSRELLEGIFLELKKLNLRQETVFEEKVNDEDV